MSALQDQLMAEASRSKQLDLAVLALAAAAQASASGSGDAATRRLDAVTRVFGGWIWETDAEHRFIYVSPSVERYVGQKPEWHYGKTRQELGHLALATDTGQSWQTQLDQRHVLGPVDFMRYQGGLALCLRSIGQPQFDAKGHFTGYVGVAYELQFETDLEAVERRRAVRNRLVRAAEILLPDEASSVACVLVDVSTTGARLRLPVDLVLPRQFDLNVPGLGLRSRCVVRWRREMEAGVEFVS